MSADEKTNAKRNAIVRQAIKVVGMRRKNCLWKELEPELRKLGATVRALEALDKPKNMY